MIEILGSGTNLVATLLGAVFCFPAGWLIDRYGAAIVLFGTLVALGGVTLGLGLATDTTTLLVLVTLTRGFGQSALSVVSIALVGRSFDRKLTWPMATYSVLMTIFFLGAYLTIGRFIEKSEASWQILAVTMVIYALGLAGMTRVNLAQELNLCGAVVGFSGGMITVIFFAIWGRLFGLRELGRIQGIVQMTTVFASAIGPELFAVAKTTYDSYIPAVYWLAPVIVLFGAAAWFTRSPTRADDEGASPAADRLQIIPPTD